ncbi:hypothetical protein ACA910_016037 [Epithemia clementina (nom. ined.)]
MRLVHGFIESEKTAASDVHLYVDDMRETGPTEDKAWFAASKMAKVSSYFGLQDAERRPPSKTPGAWAGALIKATPEGVFKLVSQERWDKTRSHIAQLQIWADSNEGIERKNLERIRGFLAYVSLTYGMMVPYLKGLHLTLESGREDRDADGWQMTPQEWAEVLHNKAHQLGEQDINPRLDKNQEPQNTVTPVNRFKDDV